MPKNVKQYPSNEETEEVRHLLPGHEVFVYLESKSWKPYKLVWFHVNELGFVLPTGRIITFAVTSAQPIYDPSGDEMKRTQPDYLERNNRGLQDTCSGEYHIMTRSKAKKLDDQWIHSLAANVRDDDNYRASRREEINVLKKLGCIEVTPKDKAERHGLYRPRSVDKIKRDRSKRPSLCVAACDDQKIESVPPLRPWKDYLRNCSFSSQ